MNRWIKITLIVLGAIVALIVVFYGSLYFAGRSIYECRGCERFNIDNVELRAGIDIPALVPREKTDCFYDAAQDAKANFFPIDIEKVDIERYINLHGFALPDSSECDFSVFASLNKKPEGNLLDNGNFYIRKSSKPATESLSLLDASTGDLWVYIKYIK